MIFRKGDRVEHLGDSGVIERVESPAGNSHPVQAVFERYSTWFTLDGKLQKTHKVSVLKLLSCAPGGHSWGEAEYTKGVQGDVYCQRCGIKKPKESKRALSPSFDGVSNGYTNCRCLDCEHLPVYKETFPCSCCKETDAKRYFNFFKERKEEKAHNRIKAVVTKGEILIGIDPASKDGDHTAVCAAYKCVRCGTLNAVVSRFKEDGEKLT